jgi:LacI family repressor for deo operon, udp, cdd, tsx, nupC, and nupG
MENIAFEEGYNILLGDTQNMESRERSFANMVKSRQADGILLFCSRMPFTILPEVPLADQLPPLVNACEDNILEGIPKVNINNVAAADEAVNYLLSLGHKKIAAITGDDKAPSSISRLEGFKKSLGRANLPIRDEWVVNGNYCQRKTESATRKMMSLSEKPTAIFCFSDDMAISCMSVLMSMGYSIPKDISVLGFDNIGYASYCYPTLTTVCQPMVEIGAACMGLLLPQLRGEKMDGSKVILNHSIVVRASTGPVKN